MRLAISLVRLFKVSVVESDGGAAAWAGASSREAAAKRFESQPGVVRSGAPAWIAAGGMRFPSPSLGVSAGASAAGPESSITLGKCGAAAGSGAGAGSIWRRGMAGGGLWMIAGAAVCAALAIAGAVSTMGFGAGVGSALGRVTSNSAPLVATRLDSSFSALI